MYILLNNINISLPQCLPSLTKPLFWRVGMNIFTVLCVYDMMLVLLKSNGKKKNILIIVRYKLAIASKSHILRGKRLVCPNS